MRMSYNALTVSKYQSLIGNLPSQENIEKEVFLMKNILAEVSTSVYEISNITAENPLKIRVFQLFIIFNVVPLYYLHFFFIIGYS